MNNCCYIVRVLSDDWVPPSGFNVEPHLSKDELYEIGKVPEGTVYETDHIFPQFMVNICQNLPHVISDEADVLVKHPDWKPVIPDSGV